MKKKYLGRHGRHSIPEAIESAALEAVVGENSFAIRRPSRTDITKPASGTFDPNEVRRSFEKEGSKVVSGLDKLSVDPILEQVKKYLVYSENPDRLRCSMALALAKTFCTNACGAVSISLVEGLPQFRLLDNFVFQLANGKPHPVAISNFVKLPESYSPLLSEQFYLRHLNDVLDYPEGIINCPQENVGVDAYLLLHKNGEPHTAIYIDQTDIALDVSENEESLQRIKAYFEELYELSKSKFLKKRNEFENKLLSVASHIHTYLKTKSVIDSQRSKLSPSSPANKKLSLNIGGSEEIFEEGSFGEFHFLFRTNNEDTPLFNSEMIKLLSGLVKSYYLLERGIDEESENKLFEGKEGKFNQETIYRLSEMLLDFLESEYKSFQQHIARDKVINDLVNFLREQNSELDSINYNLLAKQYNLTPSIELICTSIREEIKRATLYVIHEEKIMEMAVIDALTKAHSRRRFDEDLSKMIEKSNRLGDPMSLLLCDIDFFKKVNDNYGHPIGDIVLKRVAEAIRSVIRQGDEVYRLYRYGGEEFAILLYGVQRNIAPKVAERVRSKVESVKHPEIQAMIDANPNLKGEEANVTISVGVASKTGKDFTAESLTRLADQRLYEVKRAGRNNLMDSEGFYKTPMISSR